MLVLTQPTTLEELENLVTSFGVDSSAWIKQPQSLLRDVLNKDVVFVHNEFGLTALRYAVYLDLYYFPPDDSLNWFVLYEEYQEIVQSDGSLLRVDRKLPYLRETWRVTAGETSLEAAMRAAAEEGGLPGLDPSLFRLRTERTKKTEPSYYFKGLYTQRVSDEWEATIPIDRFNPDGNVERDQEEGVTTYTKWRSLLSGRAWQAHTEACL